MKHIPLVNLERQFTSIKRDVTRALLAVCKKTDFILGDEVLEFEEAFATYIGVSYCVGVANGTDALKLMGMASGITKGDEIIMQANTFIATALPFIELGATPVFVDCDPKTGQIDVAAVEKAMTKKTRAIIPVHLYGYPAPINELSRLTVNSSRLTILEDACQAHGSMVNGKKCGSFGDMAAFSFYPGKNLGAYGDGGAVVTNSKKLYEKLKIIRNIGQKKKYEHTVLGTNSRLDTIQAAVLSVKLPHLDSWNRKRNTIALRYLRELSDVQGLALPPLPSRESATNWHLFVVQTSRRTALMKFLHANGIHTGIHYPTPLHTTPALKFLGYTQGDFPRSEARAKQLLTLPLYAELTESEISYIIRTIKTFCIKK